MKKRLIKSYTYVHFGDTCPYQALLEIHPYYLFSKWCVIDLHLRTKARIYSLNKNIFNKPSGAHHIFYHKKVIFFEIALGRRLFSKTRYFIVLLKPKLIVITYITKTYIYKSFTHSRIFVRQL